MKNRNKTEYISAQKPVVSGTQDGTTQGFHCTKSHSTGFSGTLTVQHWAIWEEPVRMASSETASKDNAGGLLENTNVLFQHGLTHSASWSSKWMWSVTQLIQSK